MKLFLCLFSELLSRIKCLIKPEFSCKFLKGFVNLFNILNIMDKQLLRLKELSISPNEENSERIFKFWLRTVKDFIEALSEARQDDAPQINKKRVIISCLLPNVYPTWKNQKVMKTL